MKISTVLKYYIMSVRKRGIKNSWLL